MATQPNINDALVPSDELSLQNWYEFDRVTGQWKPLPLPNETPVSHILETPQPCHQLTLVTWNIDSYAREPKCRVDDLMEHVFRLDTPVDVIFLQEVSPVALTSLRTHSTIRNLWILSDVGTAN